MSPSAAAARNSPEKSAPAGRTLLALSVAANLALAAALVFFLTKRTQNPDTSVAAAASEAKSLTRSAPAPSLPGPKSAVTAGDPPLSRDLRPYAALGTFMAESNHIPELRWNEEQFAAFLQGMRSTYEGRGYPVDDDAIKLRDEVSAKVQRTLEAKKPNPVEDYFRTLREKESVQRTSSGLHYRITEAGHGEKPNPDSTVVVSYAGRLPDGRSLPVLTRTRVKSAVKDLLPGLAEGVQLLSAGGKALVYLPPALSFGNGRWPEGVPQGAPVIIFLELHDVNPWE